MKYRFLIITVFLVLSLAGCLEIEEGVTIKENGSGVYEMKTDMSQLLRLAGPKGKEQKIRKDTVLKYETYLDTAQSLSDIEIAMLRKASWKLRMNTDENVLDLTLVYDFGEPKEINQFMSLLRRWDKIDIIGTAMKNLAPSAGLGEMDEMGGENKSAGDITRDYFKLDWQNGKFIKALDSLAYKKIGDDESLNSFRKLGELLQTGDVLENIFVTTKFILPRAAVKAEGKNLSISEDRMTIKIKAPASDIYTDPHSFEYEIEY